MLPPPPQAADAVNTPRLPGWGTVAGNELQCRLEIVTQLVIDRERAALVAMAFFDPGVGILRRSTDNVRSLTA
jgi:hypothetical protein